MKRLFLFSVLLLSGTIGSYAQLGFGVEVGYNGSGYNVESNGTSIDTKFKHGGRIGVISDIAINDNFYFQPGINYVTNGYNVDIPTGYYRYVMNTFELPLNIVYKIGELGTNRIFVAAGPYLAWNKDGYYKLHTNAADTKRDMLIGSGASDDIKAFDLGVGLNAGYQITAGLFARARAQMGLMDLYPGNLPNSSIKNMSYCFSVGYLFYKENNRGPLDARKRKKRKKD